MSGLEGKASLLLAGGFKSHVTTGTSQRGTHAHTMTEAFGRGPGFHGTYMDLKIIQAGAAVAMCRPLGQCVETGQTTWL